MMMMMMMMNYDDGDDDDDDGSQGDNLEHNVKVYLYNYIVILLDAGQLVHNT